MNARSDIRLLAAAFCASILLALPAAAATITVLNMDGPGEGFNDATPAAPVGGNPGTTIGAQRLYVFQYAANLWGSILPSTVEIRVQAAFNPLTCDSVSGVLGSTSVIHVWRDFSGAPLSGHWYHDALADKLSGIDQLPTANDMNAQFNSSLGGTNCLPMGWYYGVDGNEGNQIELLPVVLHEFAHGLGFSTLTSGQTGGYLSSFPSLWDHYLMDNSLGLHWDQMTAAQRAASAIACQRLVWDGAYTIQKAPEFQSGRLVLRVNAPPGIANDYRAANATFGPQFDTIGITGNVVLANDGVGTVTNGCEPFVNAAAIAGNIALVDRGACTFTVKVKNAQDAGAIAVIVADSTAGCVAGMGGTDATITIPSLRITQADGAILKANLASGLNATLVVDPARLAGADNAGRMLMYTPTPFAAGSSVTHFDVAADPNLLMEPAINTSLSSSVDLTQWVFADIGWFNELVSAPGAPQVATRLEGSAPNPFASSTAVRFSLAREEAVDLVVCDISGRIVTSLHRGTMSAGPHSITWDGRDAAGRAVSPGVYLCRLRAGDLTDSRHLVFVR